MLFRTTVACALALSASSSFAQNSSSQNTSIQHEIGVGISDIRDTDDNFIGVSYRYYFDAVNIGEQPWAISPYLQRTSSLSVDYFGIDDIDSINVKGEWFYSDTWVVRGRYGRITDDRDYYDDTLQRFGADISTFANENWEYGAGFDFYDVEERFYDINGSLDSKRSDSDFSFNVFARYTSFGTSMQRFTPGWDIQLKGTTFDDEFSVELDADYYFKPNWSVGVMVIHEDSDFNDSENIVELGTNYWFNPHASIRFGLGYDTDESTLGSATLLGTFRF
ncbi:hypothetical protein Q4561_10985 [Alteromonas sp. 1_MG-2023]|uniref:hypothetical protein n=1 Tax=Alteromonas sp. 1_MG-2023 TaxID=3062669 RepID=UPI0026E491C5|nr:hypothetical protein [Alteromonas sp. 1_MG-2023]MDO6567581.1 hypothetical protein [Alteromonas sp. 1_MG-2023]